MRPAFRTLFLALLVLHGTLLAKAMAAPADDLDTIRSRIMAPLLGAPDAKSTGKLIDSMQADGTWADIDYSSKSRSAWPIPAHLSRVAALARAYRAPKSGLHGDDDVLTAALKSLDAWLRMDPQNPNWWWNQIGVPKSLLPILLLLDGELSEKQRQASLTILRRAKIGMTGQNLVWVTEITAGRGLLENDADLVAKAYGRIADEIHVGTGEGIQPDFSFHQHGPCLYSHGYGAGFITDCARIAVQVDGTAMAFPAEKIELLAHLILDGTQWMAFGKATDFGAEGREIARKGQSTKHLVGAANYMLKLGTGREEEFRALAARAAGRKDAPPLVGNRHFWRSDFMTHHRPNYYASARLHSKRLANTDGPANSEGLLSHHLADGTFVLMQTGSEYRDIYGVWDWQKIPGTTVRQKAELTGSPRRMGTTEFVGGVSDGTYGLAAFDFERGGLTAKKSWFFFDNEIVCLGADINAAKGDDVVTTLNQCHLKGDVVLATADGTKQLDRGEHAAATPEWIWHDSAAYIFLDPASSPLNMGAGSKQEPPESAKNMSPRGAGPRLHQAVNICVRNDAQSGTWHACNRRYPDTMETRDLFTAWIDHGPEPKAAGYSYVVVPGIDRDKVADYATHSPVHVLANDKALQAVAHDQLGMIAAAFYRPGAIEAPKGYEIRVDQPCLMLVRKVNGKLQFTLSNPRNREIDVKVSIASREKDASHQFVVPLPGGQAAGSSVSAADSDLGNLFIPK